MTTRTFHHVVLLGLFALSLAGCKPTAATKPAKAAAAGHALTGEIVAVNADRRTLLVHHDEIPGYMPAMTMEFSLPDADVSSFREGQRIAATMEERAPGEFVLVAPRVVDATKDTQLANAAMRLRQDTAIRGKNAYRDIGETVPDFSLLDQNGDIVSLDRFRGRRVVLNFIFTRCPVATMCPAATARMIALQRLARERGVADLQLVSISLDPAYDTPAVLKAYAETRGADPSTFTFLTGPETAVRDLLLQFGVIAVPDETIWKHTLSTLLIDRDGRILHRIDGSTWAPEEILKRL